MLCRGTAIPTLTPKCESKFGTPKEHRQQVPFSYVGTLGDIDMTENAIKKEYATDAEVLDSIDYWYTDERVAVTTSANMLGALDVVAVSLATKRGELKLAGRGTKQRAFVMKVLFFDSDLIVVAPGMPCQGAAILTLTLTERHRFCLIFALNLSGSSVYRSLQTKLDLGFGGRLPDSQLRSTDAASARVGSTAVQINSGLALSRDTSCGR